MTTYITHNGRELGRVIPQNRHLVAYIVVETEEDIDKDNLDIIYGIVEPGYYALRYDRWVNIDTEISELKEAKEHIMLV